MSEHAAEVVVIGGGIIGTAVAYYLAKDGHDVILVEKGDIAAGASGSCDGNIMAQDHEPGYDARLTLESNKLYQELLNELSMDFEYVQRGSLLLIRTEEEMKFMTERMERQIAGGLQVRLVDREELFAQEPNLSRDLLGAVECPSDAALMPILAALAMADGAKKLGARIRLHEEVTGIRLDKKRRIQAVITSKGEIKTTAVVNAAGAWAGYIGKMVGLDIPIVPRRGQLVVTEACEGIARRKISEARYILSKFHPELAEQTGEEMTRYGVAFVFEKTHNGNILLGSSREFAGYDNRTTYPVIKNILKRATEYLPVLKELNVIRTYAGLRPYTDDHLSIVSAVDEVEGFYIAAGHEGDGIGLAPLTGKLISEIMAGRPTTVPIEPLSFSRFKKAGEQH